MYGDRCCVFSYAWRNLGKLLFGWGGGPFSSDLSDIEVDGGNRGCWFVNYLVMCYRISKPKFLPHDGES